MTKKHCNVKSPDYIGHTIVTLKEQFKQPASIRNLYLIIHSRVINRSEMLEKLTILRGTQSKQDLVIYICDNSASENTRSPSTL